MTPRHLKVTVTRMRTLDPDPYTDRMIRRVLLLAFAGMAAAFTVLIFTFTWVPVGAHWLLTAATWANRAAYLTVAGIWVSIIQLWLRNRATRRHPE